MPYRRVKASSIVLRSSGLGGIEATTFPSFFAASTIRSQSVAFAWAKAVATVSAASASSMATCTSIGCIAGFIRCSLKEFLREPHRRHAHFHDRFLGAVLDRVVFFRRQPFFRRCVAEFFAGLSVDVQTPGRLPQCLQKGGLSFFG